MSRKTRNRVLLATALLGLDPALALGVTAYDDPRVVGDVAHAAIGHEDPREEKISTALQKALGMKTSVHCVPAWEEHDGIDTIGEVPTVGLLTLPPVITHLNIVRLRNDVCDAVAGDINTMKDPNKVTAGFNSFTVSNAVVTIAHEAAHIEYQDPEEGETECRAIQNTSVVARALGANEATVREIVGEIRDVVNTATEAYVPPATCVDGGPLDVDPSREGTAFWPYPIYSAA